MSLLLFQKHNLVCSLKKGEGEGEYILKDIHLINYSVWLYGLKCVKRQSWKISPLASIFQINIQVCSLKRAGILELLERQIF